MKNTYLLGALLLAASVFSGCKKEENPSKTEMISGKNWKMTAATISPGRPNPTGGGAITNLYNSLNDCDKDDIYRFEKAMTYTLDEGSTKCATTNPQVIEAGTWSWASNETIVRLLPTGGTASELNVDELTSSKLRVRFTQVRSGVPHEISATYEPR